MFMFFDTYKSIIMHDNTHGQAFKYFNRFLCADLSTNCLNISIINNLDY